MLIKLKLIILLIIIFIVPGCNGEYKVTINKDLTIEETITIMESNDIIFDYSPSINNFIDSRIDEWENEYLKSNYDIQKEFTEEAAGVYLTRLHNTFNDFTEDNILINQLFDEMIIETNNNLVNVQFTSVGGQYELFAETDTSAALLKDIRLSIQTPYEVITSNADHIDNSKNTYVWYYDEDSFYKNVELTFNIDKPFRENFLDNISAYFQEGKFVPLLIILLIIASLATGAFLLYAKIQINNKI